jgi:uncharacterized protein YdeI (BOF family)
MRRGVLVLLVLPLTLAACGGGSKSASEPTLSPVAYVKSAAAKTGQAKSEHMALKGSVTVSGQLVTLSGSGDFDNTNRVGSVKIDFNAGGLSGTIDEVISGTMVYMRSPLFSDALPQGKTWISIDLAKAAARQGIDFSSLGAQDPTQTLAQLRGLGNVTEVGTEGELTHYRGRIDVAKLPQGAKVQALTNATYGPYDVWIGKDDGYVHRVKLSFATGAAGAARQRIATTIDFSDFGKDVSVSAPSDAETFDATNKNIPGLGG